MNKLSPIKFEELEWKNTQDMKYISRVSKSKILPTYHSSLPNTISNLEVDLPHELDSALVDLMLNISKFDLIQAQKGFTFPSLLLRSESSASSQIENLTSSIRNIALAELSNKAPQNAQLIAANVHAMRTALEIEEPLSKAVILEIHEELMGDSEDIAGKFRKQVVWIGGTSYSPHGSIFTPPHHSHLEFYMDDLMEYVGRIDINPIVKAAIVHAQFETIHPFIDGNGRTGRTLIHKSLKDDGVLQTVALPVSAGLLSKTDEYLDAILSFQAGDPLPIVQQIFEALELALLIGDRASEEITLVIERWESIVEERKNSSIWKFLYILIEQPVINSMYVSKKLDITVRGANKLIERAVEYGILRRIGNEHRGIFYQSDEVIQIMDEIADLTIIKRKNY